jgi:hypothetical protein
MRRELALMLLPLLVAQGCASGGLARQPMVTGGGTADFEAVNRSLADQLATVELKGGQKAKDVEDVRMTAESTSWRDGDQVRTVPTADVSRVTREVRRRLWSGLGWGVLAGIPVGLLVASGQKNTSGGFYYIASDQQVTAFVLVDLACGLAGMAISGALRQPRVVYVAAGAGAPGVPASTAAATSGSGSRHCRLAAGQPPPGSPAIECAPAPAAP